MFGCRPTRIDCCAARSVLMSRLASMAARPAVWARQYVPSHDPSVAVSISMDGCCNLVRATQPELLLTALCEEWMPASCHCHCTVRRPRLVVRGVATVRCGRR